MNSEQYEAPIHGDKLALAVVGLADQTVPAGEDRGLRLDRRRAFAADLEEPPDGFDVSGLRYKLHTARDVTLPPVARKMTAS